MSSNQYWRSIDRNTRIVNGQTMRRLYVYIHKKDHSIFGVVEATNMKEARQKLGKRSGIGFHLCEKWLNEEGYLSLSEEGGLFSVVYAVFLHPRSVNRIGTRHQ